MKRTFKQWLRDFLGISEVITRLHNLDGDITGVMNKQLDKVDPLPVDPLEEK